MNNLKGIKTVQTIGKILKDYKGSQKLLKGTFGIEIETEATKAYDPSSYSFWTVHRDDSLRGPGPYEYVLKTPLNWGEQLDAALDEFTEKTSGVKFIPDSWTTSVHVHINMLPENIMTFGNFLTTYTLTENLLLKFAGKNRESNLFCLPLKDAEENFYTMKHVINGFRDRRYNFLEVNANENKYASLNMASLYTLGSVESRLLRGTTDIKLIKDWVGIFQNMLEYSRQDITPREIVFAWKDRQSELLTDIFGPYRKLIRVDNEDTLVEKNLWFSASLASQVKDWRSLIKPFKEIEPTTELFIKLAKSVFNKSFDELTENQKLDLFSNFQRYAQDDEPKKKKKGVPFDPFDQGQVAAMAAQEGLDQPWPNLNTVGVAGQEPAQPEPLEHPEDIWPDTITNPFIFEQGATVNVKTNWTCYGASGGMWISSGVPSSQYFGINRLISPGGHEFVLLQDGNWDYLGQG